MSRALDVIVTGDITLDWHLVRLAAPGTSSPWQGADSIHAAAEFGGARLLSRVIDATASALRTGGVVDATIHHAALPAGSLGPGDPDRHHVFFEWTRQGKPPVWRVARVLGRQAMRNTDGSAGGWQRVADTGVTAGVHVIDDAALGFRERPDLWPRMTPGLRWILLKAARPALAGPLWTQLSAEHAGRLVVIVTADDLRAAQAQISADSSWERTAQDLVWEVAHNPRFSTLAACAHVIVSFGPAGALWISRQDTGPGQATLFFDPAGVEHNWPGQPPGGMIGSTTCLAAAVATSLMRDVEHPDVADGVRRGMTAMRALHLRGYAASPADEPVEFGFPADIVATELVADASPRVAEAPVRDPMAPGAPGDDSGAGALWSILEETVGVGFDALARRIVLEGPERALENVPVARFGQLVAVDRREIECFRNVAGLIGKYAAEQQKKPLSIGVFGAPGSGKSFGVMEVAGSLLPGRMQVLEFNLSQLDGVPALRGAFHQIRDATLSGKLPLVFWDEFDSVLEGQPFGWLRHFLAPMQDGKFLDGQIAHPTGRAIFVFAGGTASSRSEFGSNVDPQVFKNAKGPDFASRLPASIDVMGPNPGVADPYYVIRRALLLRSLLKRHAPGCFDDNGLARIDPGVLRAFLDTRRFTHGARSMETVVLTSQLAGLDSYDRSALPAEAMLDQHVNSRGFMALVHQLDLSGDTLERLAEAAHRVFSEMMASKGYVQGETTDDALRTHSSLRAFAELPEDEKEQNRDLVRDIPRKLAMAGYLMVAARGAHAPFAFPADDLERLAEIEHERWVRLKVAQGWRHARDTDKTRKLHSALVAWSGLPESERDKDREIVAALPRILSAAGYTVAREGPV